MRVIYRFLLPIEGLFFFAFTFTYNTQKGLLSRMRIVMVCWRRPIRWWNPTIFTCKQHLRTMF